MSQCRSCHASIRWARTAAGKFMPLDMDPNPAGNVTLSPSGQATSHGPLEDLGDEPRYMPHRATCPQSEMWKADR